MFRKLQHIAIATALMAAAFVPEVGVANALPFGLLTTIEVAQTNTIILVQYLDPRRVGQPMRWQMQRDGNRCRTRFGNCQHFHNGFYYETPWWTLPLIIGDQIQRQNGGNSHVQWCLSRYRSYNPRNDTWLGNSGKRYRCNSPY